jgi:hypothetical protein
MKAVYIASGLRISQGYGASCKVMNTMTPDLAARIAAKLEGYRVRLKMLQVELEQEMHQQHDKRRMHYLRFLHQEQCAFNFAASELEDLMQGIAGDPP